jgi:hypothetical protein
MLYVLLALALAIIALYAVFRALKFLWLNSWFAGLLKGVFGFSLLLVAAGFGLLAYDVYSYKQILMEQPVATISFEKIEDQHFNAVILEVKNGKQQRFDLQGDQWQLDARIIKWKGYLSGFGLKPAYRLDRLSGRYYNIEKETTAKRSAFAIESSVYPLDVWRLINEHANWFSIIDARYGSATYLPMKHGALFEITLSNTGLMARPLNDVARKAVDEWK